MIANHAKRLKHSLFDCSFQTMRIHFHPNIKQLIISKFLQITEFMTQTFSIFYMLLMITFLSMTQSYKFHVNLAN